MYELLFIILLQLFLGAYIYFVIDAKVALVELQIEEELLYECPA